MFGAGNAVVVVKAQIHAGGRGKGGGVKVVKTLEERGRGVEGDPGDAAGHASDRSAGQKVQRLLIEEGSAIERELYLGLVLDRAIGEGCVHGIAVGRHGD